MCFLITCHALCEVLYKVFVLGFCKTEYVKGEARAQDRDLEINKSRKVEED